MKEASARQRKEALKNRREEGERKLALTKEKMERERGELDALLEMAKEIDREKKYR